MFREFARKQRKLSRKLGVLILPAVAWSLLAPSDSPAQPSHAEQVRQSIHNLRASAPGLKIRRPSGRISRIYGKPFGFGSSPSAVAENFRTSHALALGVVPGDLRPIGPTADGRYTQPIMYNRLTGEYKFTLAYYTQYKENIPVFRSELRLLIRNEPGHSLVLAASSLKDIQEFEVNLQAASVDLDALVANFYDPYFPNPLNKGVPELVIWAGETDEFVEPRVAVKFIADDGPGSLDAWLYLVDAVTGEQLFKESQVLDVGDVTGTVTGLSTIGPGADFCSGVQSNPLPYAKVTGGGDTTFADANGNYTLSGLDSLTTIESKIKGQWFQVFNINGSDAVLSTVATPPATVDFTHNSANTDEELRAQVNAYVEVNRIRDLVFTWEPSFPGIDITDFRVNVNSSLAGHCPGDAFYSVPDTTITFCLDGASFPNTAFDQVVHHEYGHHLVIMAGAGSAQYTEGMADCMAILTTDVPEMSLGNNVASCESFLRNADNDLIYPCFTGNHFCGQLLSGAVWSIRNNLKVTHPSSYLDTLARLTIGSIRVHVSNIFVTPDIRIDFLTLDDDDGDLTNGTPHFDEIDGGFRDHRLVDPEFKVVYVDSASGDDVTGDGTQSNPYATIQKGVDSAFYGDTLLVGPGTYPEDIVVQAKELLIKSASGPLATIISGDNPERALVHFSKGVFGQVGPFGLEGFTLSGQISGVKCDGWNPLIGNNIFIGQTVAAISVSDNSTATIVNNTIIGGEGSVGVGINIGFSFLPLAPTIRNNIITQFKYGIKKFPGVANPVNEYNDVYGNTTDDYLNVTAGTGSISVDPMLKSNNRLKPFSPCIDAGDPDTLFNDPDGSRNDIGAIPILVLRVPSEFTTIQAAIDTAVDEYNILVSPGTYNEIIRFNGKAITVISTDGPTATKINGSQFWDNEDENSVLEGFKVDGGGNIAVECRNAGPTIKYCLFVNQSVGNNEGAISLFGASHGVEGTSPARIINCTIAGCIKDGIMDMSTDPPEIRNCIIYDNDGFGINYNTNLEKSNEQPINDYNDVYLNGTNYKSSITNIGAGSISADPPFYPAWTLKHIPLFFPSPCVDAGDPDVIYNDPDGTRNDMGALPWEPPMEGPEKSATETVIPGTFILSQNFPNPFNPTTKISLTLAEKSEWTIEIYNIMGQKVESLTGFGEAGTVIVEWDATRYASGIYLYKATAGSFSQTRKMTLLK